MVNVCSVLDVYKRQVVSLSAPPLAYSQEPSDNAPYSLYDIKVERSGFETTVIKEVQVFPERTALQDINLVESSNRASRADVVAVSYTHLLGTAFAN